MNHPLRREATGRWGIHKGIVLGMVCAIAINVTVIRSAFSQNLGYELGRAREMLRVIKDDIKKNYYDPSYHGMDLDARFGTAEQQLKEATSIGQAFGTIAQALVDLEDSHTFFTPPQRRARVDYGWQMQMIGDKCYVVAVKPGSDAEAKGLKAGDEIQTIDRLTPDRNNLWKIHYLYYTLRPRPGMRLQVLRPSGKNVELEVLAKVQEGKQVYDLTQGMDIWNLIREAQNEDRLERHRYHEAGDDLFIWKMPAFDLNESEVDGAMNRVAKRKALVLDLRGNGGGAVSTLLRLLAHFFDDDVTVGEVKSRKESKPMIAKARHAKKFDGQTVVLVDSNSASAAEIFARVIQMQKRGVVLGDRTSGAVMVARHFSHKLGMETQVFYGATITVSDLVMPDGKSLEHTGVTPNELLLPTVADLAAGRDPVLSHAAAWAGVTIDAEKAGGLFPIEWKK